MSGLEIIIIVGAGVALAKVIKDQRAHRKQKKLAAAGLLPELHGTPQLVRTDQRQQQRPYQRQAAVEEEEEALPLYSPPSDEKRQHISDDSRTAPSTSAGGFYLPTYYETVRGEASTSHENAALPLNDGRPLQTTFDDIDSSSGSPTSKAKAKKWKIWKTESSR